ncbi:hypothetical protein H9660_01405 [Clostridium sp. Sa3CUN1]|uniref:TcaA 4th domain-containing protein n=1 Tax=Clostridium gallinarum TaxID=2762246 RepID=A0ABR8Q055_9CLOT|nr:hypothetical protein [Clostridium gallinarum]MBD7913797.1 hypothetical protein [Clostridium gallinarum]
MKDLKNFFESSKEYLKDLLEDINNLTFRNFKDFFNRRKALFLIVFIFLTVVLVSIGNHKSSKSTLLKDLEISMKENKPGKIYKKIRLNGEKISKEDLKPLSEYYSENQEKVNQIIKQLRSNNKGGYFTLINEKKLFFDNYHLEITPVSLEIETNFNETKLFLNNKEVLSTKIDKKLIPGKYVLRGELETLYGIVEEEKEVYIMEDLDYKLDIPATNITLTSNFEDASVFINNEDINKKVKDIQNFGPIPLEKDIRIYLQKELPWGTVKSEEVKVGNLPNININVDIVNDKLISDINEATKEFYESVFNALNKSDYNLIVNAEDDANYKIYTSIKRESLFLKNNYELNDLQTEVKNSEFYFEDGVYKGKIVIKLSYNISKKILPFLDKNVEEMFLTNMEYKDGNWIVNDVQKFNLE